MPNQPLPRGQTANIGASVIAGDLHIVGVATPYTIAIGGGAATAHIAAVGVVDSYPIGNQGVMVTNATLPPGADNLTLSW